MHDMAWIIDGARTMAELQTEATLRGIPTAGIRKEALRREIANHEIARMGTPIVTLPAPVITVPGPMAATEGTAFAQTLVATAGTAPLTWSAVGLPPGLAIDPATGAINGTPTTRGNYTAMVTVRDAATPARSDTQPITFNVAAPAPVPVPVPAPIVPLAGFRPRKWTYNRMVNRAPEDWLDAELNAWGLPIVGTVDQKREQLHRQMDNRRPWNRVGHDVPVLPGTPPARAPRNIDFSPLGWAAGALGIVALAAALLFLAILPAAAWGWDHSFGSDHSDTKVVINTGNGQNGSNGNGGNVKLGDDGGSNAQANVTSWNVPNPPSSDLNAKGFTKVEIDNAALNTWNHRVFNMSLFHAPNWDGADSWFNTLAIGPNSGGFWTSFGNTGEVIYRGNTNHLSWCLADLTTSTWNGIDLKKQFLSRGNPSLPVAMNVRIIPNSIVSVKKHDGNVVSQATSDGGDITIVLPDNGVTSVCVDYTTAAPTHESHVWFGPYDRSANINTIDAR